MYLHDYTYTKTQEIYLLPANNQFTFIVIITIYIVIYIAIKLRHHRGYSLFEFE